MKNLDDPNVRANAAMERYADGDDASFADLYDALSPRIFGFLLRLSKGERAPAEDLLQQTFLQIHRARGSFVRGADVFPWAFAIARRLFIDDRRRTKRRPAEATDDWTSIAPFMAPDQEGTVAAKDLARRLARALEELPAAQRAAFELVRRDGLSVRDAALVLGISEGAVKVRAHRAQEALRRRLDDPR